MPNFKKFLRELVQGLKNASEEARYLPQPPRETAMVEAYRCCTCGFRGHECIYPAECKHYINIAEKGYVYK